MARARSKEAIEAETNEAVKRLAGNIQNLITQVHPQTLATNAMNDAKDFVAQEANAVRSTVVDDSGAIKWTKVAYLAVAAVSSVALVVVLKSLGGK